MKRLLIISATICNSIFLGHPFLVAMVCFCIFLRSYFPILFSLLVSVSPVLVCAAILLGTLLMFGESNLEEIDQEKVEEEKAEVINENSPRQRVFEKASAIFGRNEDFSSVDRFTRKRKDGLKKVIGKEKSLLDNNSKDKNVNGGSSCGYMTLNDHEMELRKRVMEKVERGFNKLEKRRKMQEEIQGIKEVLIENHYSMIRHMDEENPEVKSKNRFAEDKERAFMGFSQDTSWKRLNEDNEDEDEDDISDEEDMEEDFDSESESSSNSSAQNILPMLDELHPLLTEENTPRPPIHISHCGSNASSSKSPNSNETNRRPNDDTMNLVDGVNAEEEEEDDDDEKQKESSVEDEDEELDNESNDDDNDEEVQEGKEDESKSAIKWTEDDQKNVIDLGSLEMERNQRLESLIAKRIAHRNLSMIAERNLIDLDGVDFPNNIPSISTRRNPFDYDDDNPGSAPSMFFPKNNPFDLTFDSSHQKSHLKENSFRQEFAPSQHREPFFRRHQSFNVGPSFLGVGNIERQDFRWKPHFTIDKNDASNQTFQRQLSEASDSKLSSNVETESVSSTIEEKKLGEEETEIISNMYNGSTLVERGSISSEDVESFDTNKKVEDNDDEELLRGVEETKAIEVNIGEILLKMEDDSGSTESSSSEIDDAMFEVSKENYGEAHPTSIQNHHHPMETNKSKEWCGEERSSSKNVMMPQTFGAQNSILEMITPSMSASSSTSPKSLERNSSFGDTYSDEAYESVSSEGNLREDDLEEDLFLELNTSGDLIEKEVPCGDEEIHESRIGSPKFDSLPNDPSLIEIREELIDFVVRSSKEIENGKEVEEGNGEDWFDSSDSLEERNGKGMDYA